MTKAMRIHEYGGPEAMRWEDVDVGAPGPGEALVRHTAVGLNFIDVYMRTGLYPQPDLPAGITPRIVAAGAPFHVTGSAVSQIFWTSLNNDLFRLVPEDPTAPDNPAEVPIFETLSAAQIRFRLDRAFAHDATMDVTVNFDSLLRVANEFYTLLGADEISIRDQRELQFRAGVIFGKTLAHEIGHGLGLYDQYRIDSGLGTLSVIGAIVSGGGSVTVNGDNSVSFDPGTDFDFLAVDETGTATITYVISNSDGGADTATVTITVTGAVSGTEETDAGIKVSVDLFCDNQDGNRTAVGTGTAVIT